MILTIKAYTEFQKLELDDNFASEVAMLSILSGIPGNDISVEEFSKLKIELMQQVVSSEPVYLFRWKGKTYGYYPADLHKIGDVIEFSSMSKTQKWNLLCAFTFREVNWITKKLHSKGWKDFHGVQVKFIDNFKKNYSYYSLKKVKDWKKVDLSVWDSFPFEILASNVGFLVGNGLHLSLNTATYSPQMEKTKTELQQKLQTLMGCMALYLISPKQNPVLESHSDTEQSPTSLQDSSSTFLQDENIMKQIKSMQTDCFVLTGLRMEPEITGYLNYVLNIWDKYKMKEQNILLHSVIAKTLRNG